MNIVYNLWLWFRYAILNPAEIIYNMKMEYYLYRIFQCYRKDSFIWKEMRGCYV